MTTQKELEAAVAKIKPLSANATRLLSILADEDHQLRDVVSIVEADAVLTGHILRTVNSAAFGLQRKVETVSSAVTLMGDKMVVGVALGTCAAGVFNDPLAGYEGEPGILWRHGLRTAIGAREIARFSNGKVNPDVAYTGGILHDIGKSVISAWMKGRTMDMVTEIDESGCDYLDAERKELGVDHCQAGLALAEHWRLPESLRSIIALHHTPAEAPPESRALVYAVHLGDFLAMMAGTGTGSDTLLYSLDQDYANHVSLGTTDLERIQLKAEFEFTKTADVLHGKSGEK